MEPKSYFAQYTFRKNIYKFWQRILQVSRTNGNILTQKHKKYSFVSHFYHKQTFIHHVVQSLLVWGVAIFNWNLFKKRIITNNTTETCTIICALNLLTSLKHLNMGWLSPVLQSKLLKITITLNAIIYYFHHLLHVPNILLITNSIWYIFIY